MKINSGKLKKLAEQGEATVRTIDAKRKKMDEVLSSVVDGKAKFHQRRR